MSDEELSGPAKVLDELLDQVTDAFVKSDVPMRANALKRLRMYLLHVQQSDEFTDAAAMKQALQERPKPPGFGSYGPEIDRAIRDAIKALDEG